ncbi:peptidase S28 [Lasiosphaeria hispida]|uniref:Peptidase S28 n=1 Tax=Lasiosphaeria hispida TaxID=260671 RepID=A0AAJ0HT86_9PEZI|nr:peptidase S28 [Lasiosphaeria hispida]
MVSPSVILPLAAWTAPKAHLRGAVLPEMPSDFVVSKAAAREGVSCSWFKQPIDHHNASLGEWSQQYCVSREWWAGEGSPVVLMTPGEEPILYSVSPSLGYTFIDNTTMPGKIAQALGAATIVLEHRFFGGSSPYDGFDSETLQYLTMDQAAADVVNFAENAVFPFDKNQTSSSKNAPWVYWGASYSAMLGTWLESFHPGVFHAYHLSSAVVEARAGNWYYYDTIKKGIETLRDKFHPDSASCSLALPKVAAWVDGILLDPARNVTKVEALKALFGSQFPIEDDDFAYAIATPFRYWQETQGYIDILDFCDAIVAETNSTTDAILGAVPSIVGNYATFFKENFLGKTCTYFDVRGQDDPLWCLNTHDYLNPFIEARTLGNPWRTWYWFLCNEPIASWATGAPKDQPSIVSRKIDEAYWQHQCEMHFPAENGFTYGSASGKTADTLNKKTGGWNRNTTRVVWTNGEFDPWRATTMSSEIRPGGPLQSTDEHPVFLIKNAQHADDSFTAAGLKSRNILINPAVQEAQDKVVEVLKKWVSSYYSTKKAS